MPYWPVATLERCADPAASPRHYCTTVFHVLTIVLGRALGVAPDMREVRGSGIHRRLDRFPRYPVGYRARRQGLRQPHRQPQGPRHHSRRLSICLRCKGVLLRSQGGSRVSKPGSPPPCSPARRDECVVIIKSEMICSIWERRSGSQ